METRDRLVLLLRVMRESLGELAWVILGVLLVLGMLGCFIGFRWIRRGGIRDSGSKFFAQQREANKALKLP